MNVVNQHCSTNFSLSFAWKIEIDKLKLVGHRKTSVLNLTGQIEEIDRIGLHTRTARAAQIPQNTAVFKGLANPVARHTCCNSRSAARRRYRAVGLTALSPLAA